MNTHHIFRSFILTELLRVAKKTGNTENILCISLYGSANYGPYDRDLHTEKISRESDYDIWIVFKRNCLAGAQIFASELFGRDFTLPKNHPIACILYDKIRLPTDAGNLLLAPMIIMEEAYESLGNLIPTNDSLSIAWYRSRSRERPPKVPVCFTDFTWAEIDMRQAYLPEVNLWEMRIPVIIQQEKRVGLGTFLELALSGNCFYGNNQGENELKRALFLGSVMHLRLQETFEADEIPTMVYEMLTIDRKAGSNFKEMKIQQFAQWLST